MSTSHFYVRDELDSQFYEWARQAAPELVALELGRWGREFVEDLHTSLLRPVLAESPESTAPHAATLREVLLTTEHGSLRAECVGDEARSLVGLLSLARGLAGKLPRVVESQGSATGRTLPLDAGDKARQAARLACERAADEVREAVQAERVLLGGGDGAGSGAGEGRKTDRAALLKAQKAIAKTRKRGLVAAVLEQAGRMERIMRSVRAAKSRRGPGAIVGVELAGDVARALPSELVALAPGAPRGLKLDFLKRLQGREVSCRKMESSEDVGRGPIVLMLDESGSMEGAREVWSKALALTLLRLASEEGRAFAFVPYSSHVVRTWQFPAGSRPTADALMGLLEFFDGGGTDFQKPLDEGMKLLESSELRKADLVMVTDGQCGIDEDWERNWKSRADAKHARLWTVLLECGEGSETSLDSLSAGVARVPELRTDADALEMCFTLGLN